MSAARTVLASLNLNHGLRPDGHAEIPSTSALCDDAGQRLIATRGDPFLSVSWHRVAFFNFLIAPEVLRNVVPGGFEVELHNGMGCVSLAAVTMRNFRPGGTSPLARLFGLIAEQKFLNLRTYVSFAGEPGALFLYGWLSPSLPVRLPSGIFGLPYHFAQLTYDHAGDSISGVVQANWDGGQFRYQARPEAGQSCGPCRPGSLCEFAMERYSGFFTRKEHPHVFRVWHPPWTHIPLAARIEDASLITRRFSWFQHAKLASAAVALDIPEVRMGRAHRLAAVKKGQGDHRVLSAFYDMP